MRSREPTPPHLPPPSHVEPSFDLRVDGETLCFAADDILVETSSAPGYASAEEGGYLVGLDTRLDDGLILEGLRPRIGAHGTGDAQAGGDSKSRNRITLRIEGSANIESALASHRDYVAAETLTSTWSGEAAPGEFRTEHRLDDHRWTIWIAKTPVTLP